MNTSQITEYYDISQDISKSNSDTEEFENNNLNETFNTSNNIISSNSSNLHFNSIKSVTSSSLK